MDPVRIRNGFAASSKFNSASSHSNSPLSTAFYSKQVHLNRHLLHHSLIEVRQIMNTPQPKSSKKPWSAKEDAMLLRLIEEYGSCGSW
jgi:hypothetical protein